MLLFRSLQGQDSSLGIFHAVAKVMFNKRMCGCVYHESTCYMKTQVA